MLGIGRAGDDHDGTAGSCDVSDPVCSVCLVQPAGVNNIRSTSSVAVIAFLCLSIIRFIQA